MTGRELQRQYLDAMGVATWKLRGPAGGAAAGPSETDAGSSRSTVAGEGDQARAIALAQLATRVAACTACELHRTRSNTVFGVGDGAARVMFIGEAPGADEDRLGEPFVGRAGQLLNAMLAAIGLRREDVYIANMLKCRPPRNRDPRPEEVACCAGFLRAQIEAIAPEVIVAVGRIAAQNLLRSTQSLGRLRGVLHEEPDTGTPVLVTYHPAYLLRTPSDKRKAWQDLRRLRARLGGAA